MRTHLKTLTERQGQFLRGILEGKARRTIAQELGVNRQAVTVAMQTIYDKWGLEDRAGLHVYAKKHNVLQALQEGTYPFKPGTFQYR